MPYCSTSFWILKYLFLGDQEMLIKWPWHKLKHVCYGKVLKKREFFWSCANYLWSVRWVRPALSSQRINSQWKNRVSQNACVCQWLMWLNGEIQLLSLTWCLGHIFWGEVKIIGCVCYTVIGTSGNNAFKWKNTLVKGPTDILQETQCNF